MSVVFNYARWRARYPEFANVAGPTADEYFLEAQIYLDNTGSSPVGDEGVRATLLNMIVAHIAAINGPASSPLVGRIGNASEGSVSVGTDYTVSPGTEKWFAQTKYGAQYWAAVRPWMRFVYSKAPCTQTLLGFRWPGWR